MKEKKQMKISLKLAIIIGSIIVILVTIIGIGIYINITKDDSNVNKSNSTIIEINKTENIKTYDEIKGSCRIRGENSNLLYKNEYESDTSYLEKVIFLDEEAKNNMLSPVDVLDVDGALRIGMFKGEFIRVKYNSKLSDYRMSLAYMEDEGFYNCTTNKKIKKAFDRNVNTIEMPELDFAKDELDIPANLSKIYSLFDITTKEDEEYIIGMYDEVFSNNNSNRLMITVVLKKENAKIDIDDEKQVEDFWKKYASYEIEEVIENTKSDYEKVDISGKTYYHRLTDNTWNGEYHSEEYYTSTYNSKKEVVSYNDYIKYIDEINANANKKIEKYYKNKNSNYIILSYANGHGWCTMQLIDCVKENNKIIIYGQESSRGMMADGSGYFIAIPTDMPVGTTIDYRECYSTSEISNLKNYGNSKTEITVDKPIIYLYPEEETEVLVKLLKHENLTCSYPKYKDEWKVLAKQNGNLKDLNTNRDLYSLYYESKSAVDFKVENEGFVVKGEDTIEFLEEKLAILGLTEREAEEFIVYWLPKLQTNKYNYIRFASLDEINQNMPLEINPNPDTIIRVLMIYKGLDNPISVNEQELTTPERKGFVAVEWGGTEL